MVPFKYRTVFNHFYSMKTVNGSSIFTINRNRGTPDYVLDGMTTDTDGNLYIATFGNSNIIELNPKQVFSIQCFRTDHWIIPNEFLIHRTKKVLKEIALPATQITSLTFGGPDMDILFVTTANKDGKQPAGSGYVYKVIGLDATGNPGVELNLCRWHHQL